MRISFNRCRTTNIGGHWKRWCPFGIWTPLEFRYTPKVYPDITSCLDDIKGR